MYPMCKRNYALFHKHVHHRAIKIPMKTDSLVRALFPLAASSYYYMNFIIFYLEKIEDVVVKFMVQFTKYIHAGPRGL